MYPRINNGISTAAATLTLTHKHIWKHNHTPGSMHKQRYVARQRSGRWRPSQYSELASLQSVCCCAHLSVTACPRVSFSAPSLSMQPTPPLYPAALLKVFNILSWKKLCSHNCDSDYCHKQQKGLAWRDPLFEWIVVLFTSWVRPPWLSANM